MASQKRMGKKPADPSELTETVRPDPPCHRCQTDTQTDPCDPCPLYGAFLELHGRTDDDWSRRFYAAWRAGHGWRVRWALGLMRRRSEERARVRDVVARFPRVTSRYPNYPVF